MWNFMGRYVSEDLLQFLPFWTYISLVVWRLKEDNDLLVAFLPISSRPQRLHGNLWVFWYFCTQNPALSGIWDIVGLLEGNRLPISNRPSAHWVGGAHQPWKAAHLGEGKPRFQTSTALWPYPLMEKASGVNLEAKSGAGVPEAVCDVLATPATSLESVVLALAFPLDYFSDVERGDLLLE